MNIDLDNNKRWGIIGTVMFHIALLLIMFLISMSPPDPPRPVIGLEINLGYSNEGMGEIQPDKPAETTSQQSTQQTKNTDEKLATQDTEESINLKNAKSNKVKPPTPVEPEKPKVDDKLIFSNKQSSKSGSSQGITGKPGDQGGENGSPTSTNYVGAGGGNGDPAWHLDNRRSLSLPKPEYNSDEQGTVVVKIWVNNKGKVTNAKVQVTSGTTTSSSKLQNLAIKAALESVFNSNPEAPEVQTGTITYVFVL